VLEAALIAGKGALAGLIIAAPVGPVGVLCVQRTLHKGRGSGLAAGLGAASADALYGCIAAFGLTLIAHWLELHETAFRVVGGLMLLGMGLRMLRPGSGMMQNGPEGPDGLLRGFIATFVLTATNPITIVAFLGVFAFFGVAALGSNTLLAAALVAGVFAGSSIWWLSLAALAGRYRAQLAGGVLRRINQGSGLLLLCFGFYGLASALIRFLETAP